MSGPSGQTSDQSDGGLTSAASVRAAWRRSTDAYVTSACVDLHVIVMIKKCNNTVVELTASQCYVCGAHKSALPRAGIYCTWRVVLIVTVGSCSQRPRAASPSKPSCCTPCPCSFLCSQRIAPACARAVAAALACGTIQHVLALEGIKIGSRLPSMAAKGFFAFYAKTSQCLQCQAIKNTQCFFETKLLGVGMFINGGKHQQDRRGKGRLWFLSHPRYVHAAIELRDVHKYK